MAASRQDWETKVERVGAGTRRFHLAASYAEVIDLWASDATFRRFFGSLLAEAPFDAYFWETPPATVATAEQPFEFVLVESPALARMHPEPEAFAEHFAGAEAVADFPNLGGDAHLVAPCPEAQLDAYPHLAVFVRSAPESQRGALWQRVGACMRERIGERPIWLSTAGLGVGWVHVRLDERPKYYSFAEYR